MKLEDRCINWNKELKKSHKDYCDVKCNGFNTNCDHYIPIKYAIEKVEKE